MMESAEETAKEEEKGRKPGKPAKRRTPPKRGCQSLFSVNSNRVW